MCSAPKPPKPAPPPAAAPPPPIAPPVEQQIGAKRKAQQEDAFGGQPTFRVDRATLGGGLGKRRSGGSSGIKL